jgi:hypothetical protein
MQNQNAALLNEVQTHLNRLAELAVAIHAAGQAAEARALITAETAADVENAAALLAAETDPINQTEYQILVAELGRTPVLDMQAFINYDLRSAFAASLAVLTL